MAKKSGSPELTPHSVELALRDKPMASGDYYAWKAAAKKSLSALELAAARMGRHEEVRELIDAIGGRLFRSF